MSVSASRLRGSGKSPSPSGRFDGRRSLSSDFFSSFSSSPDEAAGEATVGGEFMTLTNDETCIEDKQRLAMSADMLSQSPLEESAP